MPCRIGLLSQGAVNFPRAQSTDGQGTHSSTTIVIVAGGDGRSRRRIRGESTDERGLPSESSTQLPRGLPSESSTQLPAPGGGTEPARRPAEDGGMSLSYLEAVVVGALQGVTELFPVSSLGHSVILPALIGGDWAADLDVSAPESPYLAFIVGLHVATAHRCRCPPPVFDGGLASSPPRNRPGRWPQASPPLSSGSEPTESSRVAPAGAGRDCNCSRTYRAITWTTATAGTARNAPTMPNRVPPRATTAIVTAAWMFIVLPTRMGCITLPSSCCTTSTITRTPTAVQMPLETSATRTATEPATNAPTIGTNPPKNVSTPIGSANGTPRIHTPRP